MPRRSRSGGASRKAALPLISSLHLAVSPCPAEIYLLPWWSPADSLVRGPRSEPATSSCQLRLLTTVSNGDDAQSPTSGVPVGLKNTFPGPMPKGVPNGLQMSGLQVAEGDLIGHPPLKRQPSWMSRRQLQSMLWLSNCRVWREGRQAIDCGASS